MSVTLLITTYNRAELLKNSLEILQGHNLFLPNELLVIDDGGTDNTKEIVEQFETKIPPIVDVKYIYNNNPAKTICSFARNIGIKEAKNDLVITSEPEIIFDTDVIKQFLDYHEQYPDKVISAGTVTHQQPHGEMVTEGWVATYTALYNREWIFEIGGWDESFPGPWGWDDTDLLTRLSLNGHGQHIALDVKVIHQYHGLGGDPGRQNENHFFNKDLINSPEHRIANKGKKWGIIR